MNVFADDAGLVDRNLRNVVDDVDAFALAHVLRLNDPLVYVLVLSLTLQLVKMAVEIRKLIWQIVSIGNDVERLFPKPLLHLDDVGAEPVLPGQLKTVWEMVDLLILVQIVVDVGFVRLAAPQDVPVVRLCLLESIVLQYSSQQFVFAFDQFEEHFVFRIFHVSVQNCAFLEVNRSLPIADQNTGVFQRLEIHKFRFQIVSDVLLLLLGILGNELIDVIHRTHALIVLRSWSVLVRIVVGALHQLDFDLLLFPVSVPKQQIKHLFHSFVFYFGILFQLFIEIVVVLSFLFISVHRKNSHVSVPVVHHGCTRGALGVLVHLVAQYGVAA